MAERMCAECTHQHSAKGACSSGRVGPEAVWRPLGLTPGACTCSVILPVLDRFPEGRLSWTCTVLLLLNGDPWPGLDTGFCGSDGMGGGEMGMQGFRVQGVMEVHFPALCLLIHTGPCYP